MLLNSEYNENNLKVISEISGQNSKMMMNIYSKKMAFNEIFTIFEEANEVAVLLIEGNVAIKWEGNEYEAKRESFLTDLPTCVHVSKGIEIQIKAMGDSEILIQKTFNDRSFKSKLYKKEDIQLVKSSYDIWDGTAKRDIITIFDYDNASYSNMVLGEVRNYPGKWSSYIPHGHPHPEVYYYKFDKPQGFGGCFIGENVYKITDGSYAAIANGKTHPQVAAPGYSMGYVWMIRHLDGNPWNKTRIDDREHVWLLNNN